MGKSVEGIPLDTPVKPPGAPDQALPDLEQDGPEDRLRRIRKKDFWILPIPKHRRHDPSIPPEEQFGFTIWMNLVFAGAAVGPLNNAKLSTDCHGHESVLYPTDARSVSRRL